MSDKWYKSILQRKYIVPLCLVLVALIWDMWYHVFQGQAMLDSDMSSEMVLADILNKEHSVTGLTTSWIYSTEIRVFYMQWIYRIGLFLFPWSWHAARTFSMFVALILYAFACWLVFYTVKKPDIGLWAAAFALLPGGSWYFWYVICAGAYLPCLYISLFSIALILMVANAPGRKRNWIYTVILMILGLLSGMNGVKQLMIFYAPLVVAAFVPVAFEFFSAASDGKLSAQSVRIFVLSALGSFTSFVGYIINSKVLSSRYMFTSYEDENLFDGDFLDQLDYFIHSFGYGNSRKVVSFSGLAGFLGLALGIVILFISFWYLVRYETLNREYRLIASISSTVILFVCFVFSITYGCGIDYMMSLVPFGYFVLLIWIFSAKQILEKRRYALILIAWAVLLITSAGTVMNESDNPYHPLVARPGLAKVVDQLKDMGYTEGISRFWTSNVVTELSDGTIDMWTIEYEDDGSYDWKKWLQRVDHMDSFPQGRYFYLMSKKTLSGTDEIEDEAALFTQDHPGLGIVYEDDNYLVYGN